MKKSFLLFAVLVIGCNREDCFNEKRDQYLLLKLKNYEYIVSGDIHNLEVNCDNYSPIASLDSLKIRRLKEIIEDNHYRVDRDFASCPIDFCIVRIDDGIVEDKIFLGCQGNMIYVIRESHEEKIGLSDEGASQLQEIISSM